MIVHQPKILVLFGTRPEAIKLAPVIKELEKQSIETVVVSSSQHGHLIQPFLDLFGVVVDHDLRVMREKQSLNDVCFRVIERLDKLLQAELPDMILVQGDTTTALAGAIAAFNRNIAIGHVEAGLRSSDRNSPFPEEMNRRLISVLATFHFAATEQNRCTLISEGVDPDSVIVTGNPVVDSLNSVVENLRPGERFASVLEATRGLKRILLTTHRRESFGAAMSANLRVLKEFVKIHDDVCLLFPVHPNPNVRSVTESILGDAERVVLLEPLGYSDFVAAMLNSWLIVSDSGGVQEEAPSLGKPLLVLRQNTERPEAVTAGVARLVGGDPKELERLLQESYDDDTWIRSLSSIPNPFGDGLAAKRIAEFFKNNWRGRASAKMRRR